jgi:hypothetical protein
MALPRTRNLPPELESSDAMGATSVRPPRAMLVNLDTQEEYEFLFNPQTLDEKLEAKYNRIEIQGLSHERLSYKNTSNNIIPIELYLSQLSQDVIAGVGGSRPYIATAQKKFLQSLVYPTDNQDYGFVGPPKVLFVWPRMVRMIGRITRVSFMSRSFSPRTLAATQIVATLEFEEDVELRRSMEDVLRLGSLVTEENL